MDGKVRLPSLMHGKIEVIPLLDGPLPSSLDKIPDPRHRKEAERLIAGADRDLFAMPVYAFLLRFDDKCVLIDAGSGTLGYESLGRLPERLEEASVDPGDVTDILLTHLHRDHYGGLVRGGSAAFPRARLVIYESEAEFWLDADVSTMPARAQRPVPEVRSVVALYGDRMQRVGQEEVLPGICARPSPGHTPGHVCWQVTSEGRMLLALGDVIHISQIHLPAPYIAMEYDLDADVALKTRLSILDWAVENNVTVAGSHMPEPGLWKIVKGEHFCELRPAGLT
jgi:glyoxylase-like metal-dependent hydrolase (beta-lactamase superfamily II)